MGGKRCQNPLLMGVSYLVTSTFPLEDLVACQLTRAFRDLDDDGALAALLGE
jgi:hypothetical protein